MSGGEFDVLSLELEKVTISTVTLSFSPGWLEVQYRAQAFAESAALHAALCAVSVVLCAIAVIANPEEQLLGAVVVGFYVSLLVGRVMVRARPESLL
eukprot:4645219-Pleurochrysis_carterae.AAC.1